MTSILINGFPPFYHHFLETIKNTRKLENKNFDSLDELLTQHDKTFDKGKK
jgi:hypothetical protein